MTAATTSASEIARTYLESSERSGVDSRDEVRRLCELATPDDPSQARLGTEAIFRLIVEPLADRFERRWCDFYVRFFGQVIDFCRQHPAGQGVDEKLRAFGLFDEKAFLERAARVRNRRTIDSSALARIKKVLVLSRVTLGADVAVTSVVLGKLKRTLPHAEICLLGSKKSGSLLASDDQVRLIPVEYGRAGTLLERLNAWPTLADRIAAQVRHLEPDEYLIVDPDSRLTQLGLLPLTADESGYYLFESRSYAVPGVTALAALTGCWVDEFFGGDGQPNDPFVSLSQADREPGEAVRRLASTRLAAINLGVGDNPAKRMGRQFERDLLLALVDAGWTLILDHGAGEEELRRTTQLIAALTAAGKSVRSIGPGVQSLGDVNTWQGSLSGFAGLIRVSDLYVGYDSAGGHLAAALGVPGIDIFCGAVSARMADRWRPWGPRPANVIVPRKHAAPSAVLAQVRKRLP